MVNWNVHFCVVFCYAVATAEIEHIDKNSRPSGNGNTWNVLLYL